MFIASCYSMLVTFFFFNDTATTEIYTLSLHDALPISPLGARITTPRSTPGVREPDRTASRTRSNAAWRGKSAAVMPRDRKSTRLNSSHSQISYAVFCLKKKKKKKKTVDAS